MMLSLPGVGIRDPDAPPGAGRSRGGYALRIPLLKLDPSLAPEDPPPPPKKLLSTRRLRGLLADRISQGDADVQTEAVPAGSAGTQTPPPPETLDAGVQSATTKADVRDSSSSPLSAAATLENRRRCNEVHDAEVQAAEEGKTGEEAGAPGITTVTVAGAAGLPPQDGVLGCCSSFARLRLGGLSARTRIAHGSTRPRWEESMSFFTPVGGATGDQEEGEELHLEVLSWHPTLGERVIGAADVELPVAGAGEELEVSLGGGLNATLRAATFVAAGLSGGGQESAGGGGAGGGDAQALPEVDVVREGAKFEAAQRRAAAAALQARCRAATVPPVVAAGKVSLSATEGFPCDQGVQVDGPEQGDVRGPGEASPRGAAGRGAFEGRVEVDAATLAEVRNVRLGGGFEGDVEHVSWHNMDGIIMAEAWESRRMHYIAPAAGGAAPVRRAAEVVLPEGQAATAPTVLGAEPRPVLVRSRKQQTAEKLRGLFTELNARLQVLHEKADMLDGEIQEARGTDGVITQVMAQSEARRRISLLDDLGGLELRAQQDEQEMAGLRRLLSLATSEPPPKDARADRPWKPRDAVKMRNSASLRRREALVRYRERREKAGMVWSALRGCYVDADGGDGGGGAKAFAF